MAAQHSGIIPTAENLFLYDNACDPAEMDGATALWFTILLKQFPFASNYSFGPAKTPIAGNAGHIDPGVYRLFVLHDQAIRPLLFIEWRRAAPRHAIRTEKRRNQDPSHMQRIPHRTCREASHLCNGLCRRPGKDLESRARKPLAHATEPSLVCR